ncbi:hypothetical protein E2C01_024135 [Portunus trituberculatus]|uniref:Uncharacterized protein n=1 Tax=Portunus trituberculatus TaxID=210409 RepID=A0A5B7E9V3_PORTR|nr:hypothetical protein [Portunus trituberculatus]
MSQGKTNGTAQEKAAPHPSTHHFLQLLLVGKMVGKSTMQSGKTDKEFSQERMKGNSVIHPTLNSTEGKAGQEQRKG